MKWFGRKAAKPSKINPYAEQQKAYEDAKRSGFDLAKGPDRHVETALIDGKYLTCIGVAQKLMEERSRADRIFTNSVKLAAENEALKRELSALKAGMQPRGANGRFMEKVR